MYWCIDRLQCCSHIITAQLITLEWPVIRVDYPLCWVFYDSSLSLQWDHLIGLSSQVTVSFWYSRTLWDDSDVLETSVWRACVYEYVCMLFTEAVASFLSWDNNFTDCLWKSMYAVLFSCVVWGFSNSRKQEYIAAAKPLLPLVDTGVCHTDPALTMSHTGSVLTGNRKCRSGFDVWYMESRGLIWPRLFSYW